MAATTQNLVKVMQSLMSKLVLLSVGLLLLMGMAIVAYSITEQNKNDEAALDALGRGTVRSLARLAQAPLEYQDQEALTALVRELRQGIAEVAYSALVAVADRKTVVSEPKGYKATADDVLSQGMAEPTERRTADALVRHYGMRFRVADKEFVAILGFDTLAHEARKTRTRNTGILIAALITLLGGVLLYLGSRMVVSRIQDVVAQVNSSVQHLRSAVSQIAALATQTEGNAENESAAVEETVRTMKGLMDAASAIAAGAESVAQISEMSSAANTSIGERVTTLNSQAMRISDLAEAIRGIADKSDILALNASLEGSRAGEAGRGFTLVGTEMRRLAETVMDAVRQVRQLANEIRDLSQAAVLASEQGQKLSRQTNENARQITLITSQQRTATEQVTHSMREVQRFTQQAVHGAKQAKATADDLGRTAQELAVLMQGREMATAREDLASSHP